MKYTVRYLDPAGNITAVIQGLTDGTLFQRAVAAVMGRNGTEQVGFDLPPEADGLPRLRMMGGEFCGNAARSFAYMQACDRGLHGRQMLSVRISGAAEPVAAEVDPDSGTSFAAMPLPLGAQKISLCGQPCTLVRMEGILHLVTTALPPSDDAVQQALSLPVCREADGVGVMFLHGDRLTPAVWVRASDTLVWESSCGSGSTACGWLLASDAAKNAGNGESCYTFRQPGGTLQTRFLAEDGKIVRCRMGGPVREIGREELTL